VSAIDNASPANESAQSSPAANVTTPAAADVTPPSVPQNVSAVAAGPTQVDVSWDASTDAGGGVVAGYRVYRDGGLLTTVTGTSYSDTAVAPDTAYAYTVSAFDDASPANESAQSSPAANVTTPASTGLEIRVNAGGSKYTDTAGHVWSADTGFNTGIISTAGVGTPISGTADDTLYQYQRLDDSPAPELMYSFDVPNGDYTVNLLFAENYAPVFAPGARLFDVQMEGVLVLDNVDIYATVGANAALTESVPVTVSDGQLNIEFLHQVEHPIIAGIEILSTSAVLPQTYNFGTADLSDWTNVDDSGITSNWQVVSGAYRQSTDVGDQAIGTSFDASYHLGSYSYLYALTGLSDYRVSVDITPIRDVAARDPYDGQSLGLMFRYQDNDNYYRVSFSARESYARLEKKVGGVFSTLATNARGYVEEQAFNLSVNLEGDLIQVTLDGDPLFAAYDTDLPGGTVALFSQDAVAFDNVNVDVSDPNPTLVVASPLAHSVQTGNAVTAKAAVTNLPAGGSVQFSFGGSPCAAAVETPPGSGFYTADCGTEAQGDYFLAGSGLLGEVLNSSSGVVASDENLRVGIQGDGYVAVGDSITLGTYDFFAADNVSQDGRVLGQQGYQASLSDLLTASTTNTNIVFNEGVGGDKTTDTLTRIDSILARHQGADRVLLLLGTNDAGGGTPLTPAQYQTNMQSLVDTITGAPYNMTVWVAKLPPALPDAGNTTRNTTMQNYNTAIDSLSGIQAGPDFYSFFYDNNGTTGTTSDDYERLSLFYNTLHPNALGTRVMSALWHNAVFAGSAVTPFYLDRLCNRLVSATCTAVSPTNHKQDLLETGYPLYVDETFTLTSIPGALADGIWIQTANTEKSDAASSYIDFTVDRNVTVYVAYDAGAASLPDWLNPATSSYTATGLTVQSTDPSSPQLAVYSRDFGAGSVTLGGNLATGASGANSNYVAIVVEQ
jgi:lysophospholipase L1-like esterase